MMPEIELKIKQALGLFSAVTKVGEKVVEGREEAKCMNARLEPNDSKLGSSVLEYYR